MDFRVPGSTPGRAWLDGVWSPAVPVRLNLGLGLDWRNITGRNGLSSSWTGWGGVEPSSKFSKEGARTRQSLRDSAMETRQSHAGSPGDPSCGQAWGPAGVAQGKLTESQLPRYKQMPDISVIAKQQILRIGTVKGISTSRNYRPIYVAAKNGWLPSPQHSRGSFEVSFWVSTPFSPACVLPNWVRVIFPILSHRCMSLGKTPRS